MSAAGWVFLIICALIIAVVGLSLVARGAGVI